MPSIRPIASLAVSAFTASLFAASLMAADAPIASSTASNSATASTAPTAAKPDSSLTVKNAPASVSGRKTCDDLKAEIEGKLQAKGVKAFTLDIVPAADVKTEKIVGSCEAGAKKITYKRG